MLKHNLITGYLSQIYVSAIGIIMVPFYIKYLGAEAYGLVGFFAMLLAWFQLLDMGLSPALSRELSRFRAGSVSALSILNLLRCLEWVFLIISFFVTVAIYRCSSWIANSWLNVHTISVNQVVSCIIIMGMIAGTRWFITLYRGGLMGLENQILLNNLTAIAATARSIGVFFVLHYISPTPYAFFIYQLIVSVFECILFRFFLYKAIPSSPIKLLPQWESLKSISSNAGSLAFVAVLWVVLSQTDRLLLSHYINLQDFGYLTLALTVTGAISMVSAPLQQAIQPRFIILIEKKSKDEFKKFYILMSQLSAILMCAIAGTIAIFSETLIFAWTGNSNTAQNVAPILLWYALSSGVMGMAALPFLFQFALGNLSLHIKGNILLTIVWLPLLYFVAPTYGAVGTGLAWLICNLVFMFVWIPFVHKKYATSLVWSWPLNILKIWAAGAITLYGLSSINLISDNRYVLFSWLVFVSMATTFACILVTPKISWKIVNLLRNKYGR